jgi:hypothetical protein
VITHDRVMRATALSTALLTPDSSPQSGRSGGTQTGADILEKGSRGSRLRALNRLLDYALAESQELGLAHLDKLLGAAALAVSDEFDNVKVLSPKSAASRERSPPKS